MDGLDQLIIQLHGLIKHKINTWKTTIRRLKLLREVETVQEFGNENKPAMNKRKRKILRLWEIFIFQLPGS